MTLAKALMSILQINSVADRRGRFNAETLGFRVNRYSCTSTGYRTGNGCSQAITRFDPCRDGPC